MKTRVRLRLDILDTLLAFHFEEVMSGLSWGIDILNTRQI